MNKQECYIHTLNPKMENVGILFLDNKECTCIHRFIPGDYPLETIKKFWPSMYEARKEEIRLGLIQQQEAIERNKLS